jgi:hypothetical protein
VKVFQGMVRLRFIFASLVISIVLILTVYVRNYGDRLYNQITSAQTKQNRLKQQLRQKQLRLEGYINPAKLSESLSK